MAKPRFQNPKGTRDLYPEELLRRRYITQVWRDTSIRHGFEEIDGPTFETADLYAVKSGDGILGELFQAFSGKSPEEVEQVQKEGRAPFALRPEFTPTLARMYAARAAQLPKPTKWFSIGPFFRAERPQRGRLREFLQWNADVIGDDSASNDQAESDVDCFLLLLSALDSLGCGEDTIRLRFSHRDLVESILLMRQLSEERREAFLRLMDKQPKLSNSQFRDAVKAEGFEYAIIEQMEAAIGLNKGAVNLSANDANRILADVFTDSLREEMTEIADRAWTGARDQLEAIASRLLNARGTLADVQFDPNIVRGLAYYTGTVFEAVADGERAVAGGGRYNGLIKLVSEADKDTPAVGFAMGDVVLSLLLEDKHLMPEGQDLLEAVSRPGASLRPEAFVVTADEALDPEVRRLVATLRRGVPRAAFDGAPWSPDRYETRPLHARRSYKSTRNIGKLIKDATGQHAKTLVIIESAEHATLQHLDTKTKLENIPLDQVPAKVAELTA